MLAKIYMEALLVDEELADQDWELWKSRQIGDQLACIAWMLIAGIACPPDQYRGV